MLILPKYKEIEVPRINTSVGMMGEFKCILRDEMGRIVLETPWNRNTILDQGLNIIAEYPVFANCAVGQNGDPTNLNDTALNAYVATSPTTVSTTSEWGGNPTYSQSQTKGYRFTSGAYTVREMGVHRFTIPGAGGLYCRHVVTPEIVKASNQTLDIYYKHTLFPPLGDTIQNNVLVDGVNYTTTLRGAALAQENTNGAMQVMGQYTAAGTSYQRHYDGDIDASYLNLPAGVFTTDYGSFNKAGYVANSRYVDVEVAAGLNDANLAGGILRSSTFPFNGGQLQIEYNATDGPAVGTGLPKDGTKLLNFTFRQSWARV